MNNKNIIIWAECHDLLAIGSPILFLHVLPVQLRHIEHDGVSNHQPHDCLLNRLFRRRSKKTSKLRVPGLCARNSPLTGEFPVQMASNAKNVSIWWRHHDIWPCWSVILGCSHKKVALLSWKVVKWPNIALNMNRYGLNTCEILLRNEIYEINDNLLNDIFWRDRTHSLLTSHHWGPFYYHM